MAGRYERDPDGVSFFPRFGFTPGRSYTVVGGGTEFTLSRPSDIAPATTDVAELYPTAGSIPFNLLRLYLCFSSPMSEGVATGHVHVVDDVTGKVLADVLLPPDPELWDRARRALTLLLDPGRIKQGLLPHRQSGYPLVEGRAIRVVVDSAFLDAAGRPLRAPFERRYDVGPDLRGHVDPRRWRVTPPAARTTGPLVVDFDRTLDLGLLHRCITVHDREGHTVAGSVAVGEDERSWAFVPSAPWGTGPYHLEVDHRLEDVAGNSVSRVFDRDLRRPQDAPRPEEPAVVTFRPGPSG